MPKKAPARRKNGYPLVSSSAKCPVCHQPIDGYQWCDVSSVIGGALIHNECLERHNQSTFEKYKSTFDGECGLVDTVRDYALAKYTEYVIALEKECPGLHAKRKEHTPWLTADYEGTQLWADFVGKADHED